MAGQLTTHALDVVLGRGAGGLVVEVRRLSPDPAALPDVVLDEGGRGVLAAGEAFRPGVYELTFKVGAYHRTHAAEVASEPAFLDEVPIRFGVADAAAHCHVPILLSHYGYTTYRGG